MSDLSYLFELERKGRGDLLNPEDRERMRNAANGNRIQQQNEYIDRLEKRLAIVEAELLKINNQEKVDTI